VWLVWPVWLIWLICLTWLIHFEQVPAWQDFLAPWQVMPQPPQLESSELVSTHAPEQRL
jgi:hypothetical protein